MDINKPISNPELLNLIKGIKHNKADENLFWQELFKAKFLCPVKMEIKNTIPKKNEKIVLEEKTDISLLSIDNSNGEHFLMAFTDWKELRKWNGDANQKALVLTYEEYQNILSNNNSPYQGIVINPFGENLALNKQLLLNNKQSTQTIKKGESVMLGIPREYPTDMVNMLKDYFKSNQCVERAYLLWMVRGDEGSYLLILDSKISPQKLFPIIGKMCNPFLKGKLLDMIPADSGFGKNAIEGQTPFYQV